MGSTKKRVQYRYDAVGNRSLMIDPDGGRFSYAYDSMKQIKTVQNPQGERTTFSYDNDGRRTLKLLANGTRASFTYDDANNVTTLANLKSDSSVISKFDYQYDNVGNRTSVLEADGSRVTWSYDNSYQLLAEHRTGTSPYRNTFTYDKNGNRLVKNENNARTTSTYDPANQLKTSLDAQGTTTYVYDNDGNQQRVITPTGARTTTTWNYENKTTLVELPTGTRNTMSYEPDGLRVKLEDSSGTKKFIWDEQAYLAESDENNEVSVVYTNEPAYFGNLISQHRKTGAIWTPSYYHQEALGSTRELTNSAETITDTYLYDAWGNVVSSSGTTINPFQWTGNVGYYFDADTENQYIRARTYRPTIGRWLSVDPVGFEDGFNLYSAYFVPNLIDAEGTEVSIARFGTALLKPRCDSLQASVSWKFTVHPWPCRSRVGYFIQKVSVNCRMCKCKERVTYTPGKFIKPCPTIRFTYYESWKVFKPVPIKPTRARPNPPLPRAYAIDTAIFTPKAAYGHYRQRGVVRFYCERLKTSIRPGEIPKITWKVGRGIGQGGCITKAGKLPRIAGPPSPAFWNDAAADGPTLTRSFRMNWDCCCHPGDADAGANP